VIGCSKYENGHSRNGRIRECSHFSCSGDWALVIGPSKNGRLEIVVEKALARESEEQGELL
jgi:hypothetical protein